MPVILQLFWEYLLVGLFTFGGGMATIPFLQDMGERTAWFTQAQLADMIAVSESTPGPIGVNMATYVGFNVAGIPGAVVATLGFVLPGFLVVLALAYFISRYSASKALDRVFYGLRPVSAALIAAALVAVAKITLLRLDAAGAVIGLSWPAIGLALLVWVLSNFVKPTKKLHPAAFLGFCAVMGVVFWKLTGWQG